MPKHLRLLSVDEHGEYHEVEDCPGCLSKEDELVELTRKMRGMARELAELRRDKEAEARAHEAWPSLLALFTYWKQETKHSRAVWTADRFWEALPLWKKLGSSNCAAGVAGIAYDPNMKQRKNGSWERFDTWELLFKNAGTLERYIKRRPKTWTLPEQFAEKRDAS